MACESSGVVRRAMAALGHEAWSCDLLPSEDGSLFHITGDVLPLLEEDWDLLIAHPPCTYLCNSGAKHLYIGCRKENGPEPERWEKMRAGVEFYRRFRHARARRKAIENPVMHGHAMELLGFREPRQFVQPWWFGEPAFKATGFELENLPPLQATRRLTPPKPGTAEHKAWSRIHRASPGPNRWRERSKTFAGMAAAMAAQWAGPIERRAAA